LTRISIGIPDSFLIESQSLLDKSIKTAQLARACSIFRVKNIFIYKDWSSKCDPKDAKIMKIILEYLDTPPYLRKKLFRQVWILKFAGMLPPIKSPHHKCKISIRHLELGDVRVGVVFKKEGNTYVDVGLDVPIRLNEMKPAGKKILVKVSSKHPEITGSEISTDMLNGFWGYSVSFFGSLGELLGSHRSNEIILTSINGRQISENHLLDSLKNKIGSVEDLLVVFGSPKNGLGKIIRSEGGDDSKYPFMINMFPDQGTDTIRVEEAILGSLAILNNYIKLWCNHRISVHESVSLED
jgi:predicted SPOUT superfamily RNA methylase MTH1